MTCRCGHFTCNCERNCICPIAYCGCVICDRMRLGRLQSIMEMEALSTNHHGSNFAYSVGLSFANTAPPQLLYPLRNPTTAADEDGNVVLHSPRSDMQNNNFQAPYIQSTTGLNESARPSTTKSLESTTSSVSGNSNPTLPVSLSNSKRMSATPYYSGRLEPFKEENSENYNLHSSRYVYQNSSNLSVDKSDAMNPFWNHCRPPSIESVTLPSSRTESSCGTDADGNSALGARNFKFQNPEQLPSPESAVVDQNELSNPSTPSSSESVTGSDSQELNVTNHSFSPIPEGQSFPTMPPSNAFYENEHRNLALRNPSYEFQSPKQIQTNNSVSVDRNNFTEPSTALSTESESFSANHEQKLANAPFLNMRDNPYYRLPPQNLSSNFRTEYMPKVYEDKRVFLPRYSYEFQNPKSITIPQSPFTEINKFPEHLISPSTKSTELSYSHDPRSANIPHLSTVQNSHSFPPSSSNLGLESNTVTLEDENLALHASRYEFQNSRHPLSQQFTSANLNGLSGGPIIHPPPYESAFSAVRKAQPPKFPFSVLLKSICSGSSSVSLFPDMGKVDKKGNIRSETSIYSSPGTNQIAVPHLEYCNPVRNFPFLVLQKNIWSKSPGKALSSDMSNIRKGGNIRLQASKVSSPGSKSKPRNAVKSKPSNTVKSKPNRAAKKYSTNDAKSENKAISSKKTKKSGENILSSNCHKQPTQDCQM